MSETITFEDLIEYLQEKYKNGPLHLKYGIKMIISLIVLFIGPQEVEGNYKNFHDYMMLSHNFLNRINEKNEEDIEEAIKSVRCDNKDIENIAYRLIAQGFLGDKKGKYYICRSLYALLLCCRYNIIEKFSSILDKWVYENIHEQFPEQTEEMKLREHIAEDLTSEMDKDKISSYDKFKEKLSLQEKIMSLKHTTIKKYPIIAVNEEDEKGEFDD